MTADALPVITNYALAESVSRTTARRELKQARKWPAFREDDAERVVQAVRAGLRPSKIYELAGYPSRREVNVWRQVNPEFAADMDAAAEDRADELVAQGMEVSMDQARDPSCRKVEVDYCKWLAGKLSARYAQKTGDVVNNTQVNVQGDVNVSPADAYLSMIGG